MANFDIKHRPSSPVASPTAPPRTARSDANGGQGRPLTPETTRPSTPLSNLVRTSSGTGMAPRLGLSKALKMLPKLTTTLQGRAEDKNELPTPPSSGGLMGKLSTSSLRERMSAGAAGASSSLKRRLSASSSTSPAEERDFKHQRLQTTSTPLSQTPARARPLPPAPSLKRTQEVRGRDDVKRPRLQGPSSMSATPMERPALEPGQVSTSSLLNRRPAVQKRPASLQITRPFSDDRFDTPPQFSAKNHNPDALAAQIADPDTGKIITVGPNDIRNPNFEMSPRAGKTGQQTPPATPLGRPSAVHSVSAPAVPQQHAPAQAGAAEQAGPPPQVASMQDFLSSHGEQETQWRGKLFNEGFRERKELVGFVNQHLKGGSVAEQLQDPQANWSKESFQAMFLSAWLGNPTEKGSYLVDLSTLGPEQMKAFDDAFQTHCNKRKSSHFSGAGRSASDGQMTLPLAGYGEILVQKENIGGRDYVYLKTEAHKFEITANPKTWGPAFHHAVGYVKKEFFTGAGNTANPDLKEFAEHNPDVIRPREAENYTNEYKDLLTQLGLQDKKNLERLGISNKKMVPARTMLNALYAQGFDRQAPEGMFKTSRAPAGARPSVETFLKYASNEEVSQSMQAFCDMAEGKTKTHQTFVRPQFMDDKMLGNLRGVAEGLKNDPDDAFGRVHRETIYTPDSLDFKRNEVLGTPQRPTAAGDLIMPSAPTTPKRADALRRPEGRRESI